MMKSQKFNIRSHTDGEGELLLESQNCEKEVMLVNKPVILTYFYEIDSSCTEQMLSLQFEGFELKPKYQIL